MLDFPLAFLNAAKKFIFLTRGLFFFGVFVFSSIPAFALPDPVAPPELSPSEICFKYKLEELLRPTTNPDVEGFRLNPCFCPSGVCLDPLRYKMAELFHDSSDLSAEHLKDAINFILTTPEFQNTAASCDGTLKNAIMDAVLGKIQLCHSGEYADAAPEAVNPEDPTGASGQVDANLAAGQEMDAMMKGVADKLEKPLQTESKIKCSLDPSPHINKGWPETLLLFTLPLLLLLSSPRKRGSIVVK